ncbi:MAG: hypothetical protein KJI69_03815 [Patescibacteria group bacterium]|nr:hypothetical protein [Patescibacteria group bacterium]
MVKGFKDSKGTFHPITQSSRKKRMPSKDMVTPTGGVKVFHTSKYDNEGYRLKRTIVENKPSYNWMHYVRAFPDAPISKEYSRSVKEGHGDLFLKMGGSFVQALASGDMYRALERADGDNKKRLMEMGIKFGEPEFVDYRGSNIRVETWTEPDGAGHGSYKHAMFPDGTVRNLDVFARPAIQYCWRCHKGYKTGTSTGICKDCGAEL